MKTTILIIALFMTACSPKKRSEKLYNNNYGIRYFVSEQYELDNDYSLFVFEPQGDMYWQMLDPYDNSVIAPDSAFYVGQSVIIGRDGNIIGKNN